MLAAGHMVQVLHVLMLWVVAYLAVFNAYIVPAFLILVLLANTIFGRCPMTMLSSLCFKKAGAKTYSNLANWLVDNTGMSHWLAGIVLLLTPILVFVLGWYAQGQILK